MKLKHNIVLYYLFGFLTAIQFYGPIFAIFFQSLSLDQTQIISFLSVYGLSTVIFEIPTGIFSDYIGRKNTLVISSFLLALCFLIFTIGTSYWHFIIAYLIMGLAWSFRSGTDHSFVYDTLLELEQSSKYKEILGKSAVVENLAIIISMGLGGFLYTINHSLPYLLTTIFVTLSIPITMCFIEPTRKKSNIDIFHHTISSFRLLKTNKTLLLLVLFDVVTVNAVVLSWFMVQQYYRLIGIPVALFGIITIISKGFDALSSNYAHRVENKLKLKVSLLLIAFLVITGYLLMSIYSFYWAFLFTFLLSIAFGLSHPILSDYINKYITSDKRATVLSMQSQIKNILYLLIPPLIGKVADISLQLSFKVMSVSTLIIYVILLLFLKNKKVNK